MPDKYVFLDLPGDISCECREMVTRLIAFDRKYPTALEPEFLDFLDVVEFGLIKHPTPPGARANWLTANGSTVSHTDMHDRISHHFARSYADPYGLDAEFPRDHLLFAITRCNMIYTRRKRRITHDSDPEQPMLQDLHDFLKKQDKNI